MKLINLQTAFGNFFDTRQSAILFIFVWLINCGQLATMDIVEKRDGTLKIAVNHFSINLEKEAFNNLDVYPEKTTLEWDSTTLNNIQLKYFDLANYKELARLGIDVQKKSKKNYKVAINLSELKSFLIPFSETTDERIEFAEKQLKDLVNARESGPYYVILFHFPGISEKSKIIYKDSRIDIILSELNGPDSLSYWSPFSSYNEKMKKIKLIARIPYTLLNKGDSKASLHFQVEI